jgi:hypothetical protein
MTNWVYNNLLLVGEPDKIAPVIIELNIEDGDISFDKIRPCPQELRDTAARVGHTSPEQLANIEKYGYPDWADWCRKNWGTMWSPRLAYCEYLPGSRYAHFYFETAWTPPYSIIEFLSKKYPEVYFIVVCREWDMYFEGYFSLLSGEEVRGYGPFDMPDEYEGHFWYDHNVDENCDLVYADGDVYP